MKLLFGNQLQALHFEGTVATIGNFDGVHLGHQALLSQLVAFAHQKQLPSTVVLFEPQPGEFFMPKNAPARLTTLREKLALMKQSRIDYVHCLRFSQSLAVMSAERFAQQLFTHLNVKLLLVGHDFRFGKDRKGDLDLLVQLGAQYGCQVMGFSDFLLDIYSQQSRFRQGASERVEGVYTQYMTDDERDCNTAENASAKSIHRVSSTLIRKRLAEGNLTEASQLLGRLFSLQGRVVYGKGLGRQWGIPTANLRLSRKVSPVQGIFCVQVKRASGTVLQGVASLGSRPTVGGIETLLEVHVLNFSDNLYGERVEVLFLKRLRDEVLFASVDALIAQIHEDIAHAQQYFGRSDAIAY